MRQGIPTMFKGVLMRSRTEARWAAFFDYVGWDWEYEPFDLEGYIPDFAIQFGRGEIVVEVKSTDEDFALAQSKLEVSGWDGDSFIVGHRLDGSCCGRFGSVDGPGIHWGQLELFRCLSCGEVSPLHVEGSWACRHCGATEGHRGDFDISKAWAACGNRVQWKKEEEAA